MIQAAKTATARPADIVASDAADRRLAPQALSAPRATARGNWELRPLGATAFALASARS